MPSLYQLKKALFHPWKLYKRRQEKLEPGFMLSAMELHYYRPAFYKWCGAVHANPDLLYEADIGTTSVVVDAGAYTGEWAQEIIDRYHPTIHAFEPDPGNYAKLEKRAQDNPALLPYEYGLGDKNERALMSLEFLGSSIYEGPEEKSDKGSAEVQIRDIAEVWDSLGLGQVDLMKINIEGAEFPLLERMIERDLLGKVDCFLIQFHEWHPGAYHRRRKIRRALRKTHRLAWDHHFIWERWIAR